MLIGEARKVRRTRPALVGMDHRQSRGRRRTPPRSRAYELWPDARRLTSSCSSVISPLLFFLTHTLPHPSKPVLYLTSLIEICSLASPSISFSLTHQITNPPPPTHSPHSNHVCRHPNPLPQQGRLCHRRHPGIADREQDQAPQDE